MDVYSDKEYKSADDCFRVTDCTKEILAGKKAESSKGIPGEAELITPYGVEYRRFQHGDHRREYQSLCPDSKEVRT